MFKILAEILIVVFAFLAYYRGGFHSFFKLFVFFIPFKAISFDVGVGVVLPQAILIIVLGYFFILQLERKDSIKYNSYWLVFIVYAVIDTVVMSGIIYSSPDINTNVYSHLGVLRTDFRYLVQIVRFVIFSYLIFIVIVNYYEKRDRILEIFQVFVVSITILSILGIIQLIVFSISGIDILPIERGGGIEDTALIRTNYLNTIRLSSLAGEPKSFGMVGVFGLILTNTFSQSSLKLFDRKYVGLLYGIYLVPIIFSYSTSAYILLLIFVGYKLINNSKINFKVSAVVFLFLISWLVINQSSTIIELVLQDRLFDRSIFDDYDSVVMGFLLDNKIWTIFGSGLGNIHNIAHTYIPQKYAHYMYQNIFVAKSGYLRIISELGIVGFFLFGLLNMKILYPIYKKNRNLFHLSFLVLLMYLARGYLFYEYIVTLSLCHAYCKELTIKDE